MQRLAFIFVLGFACLLYAVGARAADSPFTVSGIPVDATAASAGVAQNIAIDSGRGRAWTVLYRRLTKSQDWGRQPAIDDTTLQRMIRSYEVSKERRSTTRFVASMTYDFNPDAVRRLLRAQNIAFVDLEAKPVLVIAMAPGYSPHSGWAAAWTNPKYSTGAVPIAPPVGDALDNQALGALNFSTAQWQDVEPAASRLRATDAFLVQAAIGKGNVTVALRRLGPGVSPPISNVVVPIKPGLPPNQVFAAAADATSSAIIDAWKSRSAVDFNKHFKLTADVRITSSGEWGTLMQKLAAIPNVTDVDVVAMNAGEARVALTYVGTSEQLEQLAAQSNLELANTAGTWQLALQSSAPGPVPTPIPSPNPQ